MEAEQLCKVANLEACKCAPASVLQVETIARDACITLGSSKLLELDGAGMSLTIPRGYHPPDAMDAMYQEMVKFLRFRESTQTTDEYLVKFDLLRQKAEGFMQDGGAFPGALALLSLRNANPPRH